MKTETIKPIIEELVKVIFKERDQRVPMIGKFVELKDADYLYSKDMVRFVNQSKFDYWTGNDPALTKIYKISDFSQIRKMNEPEKVIK